MRRALPETFAAPLVAAALAQFAILALAPETGAAVPSNPANARLQGRFQMHGTVTEATNITGERRGQHAKRAWTFTSSCVTAQCRTVRLIRHRQRGVDRLTLRLRHPGYYTGGGEFYAPLRCGGHTIRHGESVPFTITVRIRSAMIANEVDLASALSATYTNRSRTNLTRCVAIPGHDAASYRGMLVSLPPPPAGVSGQSPAGS